MKKKLFSVIVGISIIGCLTAGCGNKNIETENEPDSILIEGMDNMSDSELNEELIRRADEMEVVPDKK